MSRELPYLEILNPDGQIFTVEITQERFTIGRLREHNDLTLEPDPQQLVSRIVHCAIEREAGTWWVVDNGSVNKTFLQSGGTVKVVEGRAPLADGDVIRLLGQLLEGQEPLYWQLAFRDPMKTFRADIAPKSAHLEYDWIQAKLYRVQGAQVEEIKNLRPQEHKLIRYMDQRNRANGNVAVMCTYEELIAAIWGEDQYGHTEDEINRLAWELRQKVEPEIKNPRFLENVKGLGYRLVTRPKG